MDIKAWVEQYSPAAAMMLDLSDVFETFDEDENQVATIFLNHWPKVRDFIRKEIKTENASIPLMSIRSTGRPENCSLKKSENRWPISGNRFR